METGTAMALFRFRTRNPERDLQTDKARFERLNGLLDEFRSEIEQEKAGLKGRYERIMADAAFSQQALEDERGDSAISQRIDGMTETMKRYAARLATLDGQLAFAAGLSKNVNEFTSMNSVENNELHAAVHAPE